MLLVEQTVDVTERELLLVTDRVMLTEGVVVADKHLEEDAVEVPETETE
jgi:hypothetical protein